MKDGMMKGELHPRSLFSHRFHLSSHFRLCALAPLREIFLSSKSAGDVILGLFLGWDCEQLCGDAGFDQLALVKERGLIRDAGRLLHIMGYDHDRVFIAELENQVFDP